MIKEIYAINPEISQIEYLIFCLRWALDDLYWDITSNQSIEKIEEDKKEIINYYIRLKRRIKEYINAGANRLRLPADYIASKT